MAAFLISVKPMENSYYNAAHLINELVFLFFSYYIFLFSDYVTDPYLRYVFGWVFLTVLLIDAVVNIGIVISMEIAKCL